MAITTLSPPDSITFEVDHDRRRRRSIASCSRYSTYSLTSSSSPEFTSPTYSTHAGKALVTPESDCGIESPTVVPKVEEAEYSIGALDKLIDLEDAKPVVALPLPRKRGRPRIHPVVEQKKSAHARSKTGCGTCRRRKKKCDETQPTCQNCEKNNVICDGYESKKPWRSGVDTTMDFQFFDYFHSQLGTVLSVTDNYNPFVEVIIPMAMEHEGLMASLLYLSGSCLVANATNPNDEMLLRQAYHSSNSLRLLHDDLNQPTIGGVSIDGQEQASTAVASVGDPSIAQTLLLCLQTVCGGDLKGNWRVHMKAMKFMLSDKSRSFHNERFRQFVLEFLLYHDYCSSITSLDNPLDQHSLQLMEDFRMPAMVQSEVATLLGVMDGLFGYISRIRHLRDEIRLNRERGQSGMTSSAWGPAWTLHAELEQWQCVYPPDTPRYWASLLYRQCVFLYLHRTIQPSRPCVQFTRGVGDGLEYLRQLPRDQDDSATQSILLMPLFLLGCSAFEPEQRPEISQAFERLQKWSTLGNIRYARAIVEEIWETMDDGRAEETWDWESVIFQRGWDFLIT